jgi:hypothetical protein
VGKAELLELVVPEDETGGAVIWGALEVVPLCELICPVICEVNCEKPMAGDIASKTPMSRRLRLRGHRLNCARIARGKPVK